MNLADMWEAVAAELPDASAQIHGDRVSTYREFEDRAARLAAAFAAHGAGVGTKVGMYLYNAPEYLETTFAALKLRAVPVNVNFRYLADELHYLLDNADAEILVYHGALAERVQAVRDRLPRLRLLVQVETADADRLPLPPGAVRYEDLIAAHAPAPRMPRDPHDHIFLYTGGTTGLPKGVMWTHADLFKQFSAGYMALGGDVPTTVEGVGAAAKTMRDMGVSGPQIAGPPLMHGMAWFTAMSRLMTGGTVVTLTDRSFDAHELWRAVQEHRVNMCVIVGDAFARPMIRALEEAEAQGRPYDVSSLMVLVSGGVMWTPQNKTPFLDRGIGMLMDGLGSSEATGIGMMISTAGDDPALGRFMPNPGTRVLTEDGRDVQAGSGEIGLLAVTGALPQGYYKDPAKSANTWKTIDGVRYSFPGDWARIEADGSITLLGRGSVCINTGGEKVFPEEVEEALKLHPDVEDCIVVGVPDERWGEAIAAVVQPRGGAAPDPAALVAFTRERLAAYKSPKHVVTVAKLVRSPAGKADYRWARDTAKAALGA
ncbi:MAG: AMP-binding protein [bacterium]|nr:AMP-binding protein [bacterium]